RAGEAYDPSGKHGLSMLATTVLNAGSQKHSRAQLQAMQEDSGLPPGAMLKFEGGSEAITFSTRCLPQDFGNQLALLGESLTCPNIPEDEKESAANTKTPANTALDKTRAEAINAIKRAEDTISTRLNRAMLQSLLAANSALFPASPADRIKNIGNLKSADIKSFISQ